MTQEELFTLYQQTKQEYDTKRKSRRIVYKVLSVCEQDRFLWETALDALVWLVVAILKIALFTAIIGFTYGTIWTILKTKEEDKLRKQAIKNTTVTPRPSTQELKIQVTYNPGTYTVVKGTEEVFKGSITQCEAYINNSKITSHEEYTKQLYKQTEGEVNDSMIQDNN